MRSLHLESYTFNGISAGGMMEFRNRRAYLFSLCVVAFFSLDAKQKISRIPVHKWGFYELSKHAFDPYIDEKMYPITTKCGGIDFNTQEVRAGDTIFLRARCADIFFEQKAPSMRVPYTLISHGEYKDGFMKQYASYLDDPLLIAWFTTHPCNIKHSKLRAIPLGIPPGRSQARQFQSLKSTCEKLRKQKKTKLLYINFAPETHPDRGNLLNFFADKDFCTISKNIPHNHYLEEMAAHKFTLSPPGYGPDCYRTWEALLVGSIPIVISSHLNDLYEGLPVLVVDSWDEVTCKNLQKKYRDMTLQTYDLKKLYMNYWKDLILSAYRADKKQTK